MLLFPPAKNPARLLALALCLSMVPAFLPAQPVLAQSASPTPVPEEEDDQETARKALENKEILPLSTVLARIEGEFTGDVVEIELERKRGAWVYEIEIIDADGRVRDIDVDARTGDVITIEFDE
ncbi:MAG: PepSY domain-containing protein [Rhodospirillaceae bacterium]|nr:PepSY domain-containing protein [Rhodospirillaceae bacterium]